MLTGHEKALPLTFFYLNMKGRGQHRKRTCGTLLEDSRTLMTYAGGIRNRRKLDKKGGLIKEQPMQKPLSWRLRLGVPGSGSTKRNQETIKEMAWSISDNRGASRRSFLSD